MLDTDSNWVEANTLYCSQSKARLYCFEVP
jgi:hypothetical protein